MLTALEGVCCRGQQTLPEVTAAKHLALAEGHVSEVSAGRTASVPPEGIKLPVIQETPLLHQPPEQYTCTSTRQRQSSGIGPEKSGLVAAKRKRAKSGSRVVAPCFLNPSNSMHHNGSQRTPWLFWQQDAAGSNPVSPMRSETSPQLVFKPSRKGRFFIALPAQGSCLKGLLTPRWRQKSQGPHPSRSRTWTSALSTGSTLTWSPTSLQGSELKFRLLSHPRICNKPNPLSQFA